MKNVYLIADIPFEIEYKSVSTGIILNDYLCNLAPVHTVSLPTSVELDFERNLAKTNDYNKLENVAILRKISTILLENHSTILFHSSAILYGGKAHLFTAPSGTGKSTHVNNIKTALNGNLVVINDDKPFIKITDNGITVYGSPWCGKHNIGANVSATLGSIVFLTRGLETTAKKVDGNLALTPLLKQCFMLEGKQNLTTLLALISKLVNSVNFYSLTCTKELNSAYVTINTILKGDINEN